MDHFAPGYLVEVLEAGRNVLKAEERLASEEVPDGELYDLVLMATGEVIAAEDALYRRARFRVMHGQKFEG